MAESHLFPSLQRLKLFGPVQVIVAATLWRCLIAFVMPVTQDEAYYYDWAHALAWGYFDHPPGVAVLGLGALLVPASPFVSRLGTLLVSTLTLLALLRLYRACGLRDEALLSLSLLLAAASVPGMVSGVITTPDTVLALFWVLALHECFLALTGCRRRWLVAGVFTGLGLLGKYTMLMIGPVFLVALLAADRRALRTPWPYLGCFAALLVFLPNLIWNAQHDWVTLRFQFGHGFSADTGAISMAANDVLGIEAPTDGEHAAVNPLTLRERFASAGYFAVTQLALFGLPLLTVVAALLSGLFRRGFFGALRVDLSAQARVLLMAAALVPLGLFGIISFGNQVEPNWAALYIVGAAPFVACLVRPFAHWVIAAALGNVLVMGLYAVHAATPVVPLPHAAERVLRETHGYQELADYVSRIEEPILVDRYQTAAMLNFYGNKRVTQWLGLSRPSEYGRGHVVPLPNPIQLHATGFVLVSWKYALPEIPGYRIAEAQTIFDCRAKPLSVLPGVAWPEDSPCGAKWLHIWRILRYSAEVPKAAASAEDGNVGGQ